MSSTSSSSTSPQCLSPAQRLPATALIKIAKYLHALHTTPSYRSLWDKKPKYTYMVRFLSVCRAWRSACRHLLCHEAWLGYGAYFCRHTAWKKRNRLPFPRSDHYMDIGTIHDIGMLHYTKLLVVYASVRDLENVRLAIPRGNVLGDYNLPNVTDILFCVYNSGPPFTLTPSKLHKSTEVLAQRIHALAPNVNAVMVVSKSRLESSETYHAATALYANLFTLPARNYTTQLQVWSTKGTYH